MLPSFCRDTVVRIRPGTKELRGSTVPDWENATTAEVSGCSMQPASTSLSTDGRVLGLLDEYTLYAPPSSDIEAGDRIEFDGKVYEINGEVRNQPAALRLEHIEIRLRRYKG